jgi:hypothetical protein
MSELEREGGVWLCSASLPFYLPLFTFTPSTTAPMEDESQPYAPKCAYMRPISPISVPRSSVAPVFDPPQVPTHLTVSPVHHHASAMQESAFSPAHFVDFAAKAWTDLLLRTPGQAVLNPVSPVHTHHPTSMNLNESTPPQPFTSSLAHDVTLPAPAHTPSSTSSIIPNRRFYFTPPNYSPVSPFAKPTPFVPSPLGAEEDGWHVSEGSVSPVAPRMALLNRYRSGGSDHAPEHNKPVPIPHTHAHQHIQHHPMLLPSAPLQRQRSALSQVVSLSSPLSSVPESSSKGSSKGDSPSPITSETDALGHIDAEGSVIASSSQDHDASAVEEDTVNALSQDILSATIPITNSTPAAATITAAPDAQVDDHVTRSSLAALAAAAAAVDSSVPLRWRRKPIPDPEPEQPAPRRNQKRSAAAQPESSSAAPKRARLQREGKKSAASSASASSTTKRETKSARAAKEKAAKAASASSSVGSKKTSASAAAAAAAATNNKSTARKKKESRPPLVQESDDDGGADGGQSSSSVIEGLSTAESLSPTEHRIFPQTLLVNTKFPAFYKRYHIISYYRSSNEDKV